VVEDDPFTHKAIKIRLEACGGEVRQAGDGERAYEIAYWQGVDLNGPSRRQAIRVSWRGARDA
jgi:DNA-binding response OmpR family regulator